VMPLAKGLGGGVPIGAVAARGKAAQVFGLGNHGTTFGGNPLAMRAALEVLAVMEDEDLMGNAARLGGRMKAGFEKNFAGHPGVLDIRGQGLMLGIALAKPCGDLVKRGIARGVLFNVTADYVVRLLPPLVLNAEQADEIVSTLSDLIVTFLNE
jgi:acetylornithine/N-succinyldiaminopimelate aminotransferase